jgi:YidC/Oxa1 family membrane protein insertase
MDRRSLVGLAIIALLVTLFMTYNSKVGDQERLEKLKQDSILAATEAQKKPAVAPVAPVKDTATVIVQLDSTGNSDSLKEVARRAAYGPFYYAAENPEQEVVLENELIKVKLSSRGGKPVKVELKNLKRSNEQPLVLFDADSAIFGLEFFDSKRIRFSTDTLIFETVGTSAAAKGTESKSVTFRLYANQEKTKFIEYVYTLKGNDYMVDVKMNFTNMEGVFAADQRQLDLVWAQNMPSQEKSLQNQRQVATVFYRFNGEDDVEYLSETEDEKKTLPGELKWVSFKQQYFSTAIIADNKFGNGAESEIRTPTDSSFVKKAGALLTIPLTQKSNETFGMKFYFGTNKYDQLKSYDLLLERQLNLGGSMLGWLNRAFFVPVFTWLGSTFSNYGIIILLLTIIVKLLLFPIAYKSFLSSAKMRVLKPDIEIINEKHKNDDPMTKQQATMALYKKAGVNPMAGCIPLLLQLPILFALLRLFPAMFELRQEGFWWCTDLSTYDSVLDFGFSIPWYGDHISLWALLMTISTLMYTWMNQQMMDTGTAQLPGMKWLMYLMPVLFLGFLNNYSAGLSYYYFLSNIITFGQMFAMRHFVDEGAIRAKIEEHKKKPVKTSGFMQRLEQAQRKRLEEVKKQQGGKKK